MIQSDIKISIIIPIYNTEQYLNKCLNSVCNQTYTNLEIICINDGSTDSSLDILRSIQDERIKIIDITNHGVGYARNLGIKEASGEFMIFIDSDDYVEKDYCERLLENQIKNSSDLVYCGHFTKTPDGVLQKKWVPIVLHTKFPVRDRLKITRHLVVTKKLFKTSIIKENTIEFDTTLNYAEDSLFLVTYLTFCKDATGVAKELYTDVVNPKSLCRNSAYKERRKRDFANSFKKINQLIDIYNEKHTVTSSSVYRSVTKRSNKYF